jgi:hypothetical protein
MEPEAYYRTLLTKQRLDSVLSQMNPVHPVPLIFLFTYSLFIDRYIALNDTMLNEKLIGKGV